ncbi:MAG TPA: sensor domain-containing diguanylate cyclase [Burkholderiales bacterium]|nr:sensor domain-containing diguanylate cyclase [Burkholderiales bacterium]
MLAAPIPENESARLESLRRMLASYAPEEEALDRVTRAARRMFGTPIALISLVEQDRQWFKSCIGLSMRETPRDISFCGHTILQKQPLIVEDALRDPRFADNPLVTAEPKIRFYAGTPLRNGEDFAIGALCILDRAPRALSPEECRLLDDLGQWAEGIFASRRMSETQNALLAELDEAKRECMVDPLLQIWNRCAIVDILEREAQRALRHHDAMSLLMVDVDRFDSIHQRYGEPAGDAVLKEVARAIRGTLRPYDAVGRYGETEFLVVLPDSDRHAAAEVAERLCHKVEARAVAVGSERVSCTVSTGVACIERNGDARPVDTLVASAADALLLAKRSRSRGVEGDKDPGQPMGSASPQDMTQWGDDDSLGSHLVAAQLASLRARIVDD